MNTRWELYIKNHTALGMARFEEYVKEHLIDDAKAIAVASINDEHLLAYALLEISRLKKEVIKLKKKTKKAVIDE